MKMIPIPVKYKLAIMLFSALASAFAVEHGTAHSGAAAAEANDCSQYWDPRFGDLVTRSLRTNRDNAEDLIFGITFRSDYLKQPDIPDTIDGSLPRSESFAIDIETGDALPKDQSALRRTRPQDYEHFSIVVTAYPDRPVWVGLNVYDRLGGSGESTNVELPSGIIVRKPSNFFTVGPFVSDFDRIEWPFDLGEYYERSEYSVSRDRHGEIAQILICDRIGSYPNPGCHLKFRFDPLTASIRFNRSQLDRIDIIRQHAKAFVQCLLSKE